MYDIVIIGGGPAGLAAAVAAKEEGIDNLIILEREITLGGTLNQCIHNGFGLGTFKEDLTGPEYAQRFIDKVDKLGIQYKLNTSVLELNKDKELTAVNGTEGIIKLKAKVVILAVGCREMPRSTINIPGGHNSGIFTAGSAQRFINLDGYMPGKRVVIFGSSDIGLIMARRLIMEGAKVEAVVEPLHYCSGKRKNVVQCLHDFNIPLLLQHTITTVKGSDRVEAVTVAPLDSDDKAIENKEQSISCDTILLAVEALPESVLPKQAGVQLSKVTGGPEIDENMNTNIEGIFACGNAVHYHDTVDNVTLESYKAGKKASDYVRGFADTGEKIKIVTGTGIKYSSPSYINRGIDESSIEVSIKVNDVYKDSSIVLYMDGEPVVTLKRSLMTPGDLESMKIDSEILEKLKDSKSISVRVEKN